MERSKILTKVYDCLDVFPTLHKMLDMTKVESKTDCHSSFKFNPFEIDEEPTVEKIRVNKMIYSPNYSTRKVMFNDENTDGSENHSNLNKIKNDLINYIRKLNNSEESSIETEEYSPVKKEIPKLSLANLPKPQEITIFNLSSENEEFRVNSTSHRSIPALLSRETSIIDLQSESFRNYLDAEIEDVFIQADNNDIYEYEDEINQSEEDFNELDTLEIEEKPLTTREIPMFTNVLDKSFIEISCRDISSSFKEEFSTENLLQSYHKAENPAEIVLQIERGQNFRQVREQQNEDFEVAIKPQKQSLMSILCPCFFSSK